MERAGWIFWGVVVVCLTIIAVVISLKHIELDKEYIKNGYTRQLSPSEWRSDWVKER